MRRALLTSYPLAATGSPGIVTTGTVAASADANDYEMGWAFTVGGAAVTVSALRVLLPDTRSASARLWSSAGASLATATISAVAGVWAEAACTPVTLSAGGVYVVSVNKPTSSSSYNSCPVSGATFNPKISPKEGRYNTTPGLYPSTVDAFNVLGIADVLINN